EWNGKYRDNVRRFWRGDASDIDDLAYRLSGSSDLFSGQGRGPLASINFITAHDGFTLNDLVSYNDKHNEANGENNRDGNNDNLSWNGGVEGPTDDLEIIELRERQKRNFLATLFFSQGVPMLCGGDEIGRTQLGNNNAYCQDNEISWFDWELDDRRQALLDFTREVIGLRQRYPILRRRTFFRGAIDARTELKDITWLRSDGHEMAYADWFTSWVRSIGILIAAESGSDEHLLLLLNAYTDDVRYTLPTPSAAGRWEVLLCTDNDIQPAVLNEPALELCARSLVLMRWQVD
ncbi:MAG TPA: glycogen debranching enzyme GlgX, partial [Nitrolancea sp.]|nr:glycogen debranching enzyme GlgX [Nitrolancea sp.]